MTALLVTDEASWRELLCIKNELERRYQSGRDGSSVDHTCCFFAEDPSLIPNTQNTWFKTACNPGPVVPRLSSGLLDTQVHYTCTQRVWWSKRTSKSNVGYKRSSYKHVRILHDSELHVSLGRQSKRSRNFMSIFLYLKSYMSETFGYKDISCFNH